jgi:hypothetical protein
VIRPLAGVNDALPAELIVRAIDPRWVPLTAQMR